MTTLGKYCHDFPRLAEESGYSFHLYRGRVDWSEIGELDIEDIINNRNFQILERTLINVINCNLEREYDVKILDQNFVKLFKLAQLGIDYLSYCELYLDRCVILLQEQLAAREKESELLREELKKKSEQIKKSKRKYRSEEHSYQCKKCEKIFISEVYLSSHEKRRHSSYSPTVSNATRSPEKKPDSTDRSQQTEPEKILLTISTQTSPEVEIQESSSFIEKEEINRLNKEYQEKMEKLEKEVKELEGRLISAEKALTEKSENPETNNNITPLPINFPNPFFYPSMIPYVPPCAPQPRNPEIAVGYTQNILQNSTQQVLTSSEVSNPVHEPTRPQEENKYSSTSDLIQINRNVVKSSKGSYHPLSDNSSKKDSSEESPIFNTLPRTRVTRNGKALKSKKKLNFNKENEDPVGAKSEPGRKEETDDSGVKPVPFPRKQKRLFGNTENNSPSFVKPFLTSDNSREMEISPERNVASPHTSTPVMEIKKEKEPDESPIIPSKRSNQSSDETTRVKSEENLVQNRVPSDYSTKSKNFFKKIVTSNSPKIQEISKNLKRSLTNLYDSVSSKDVTKTKSLELNSSENVKSNVIEGLNDRLRELGVDPEWAGIPKETMKQKIKTLDHRRKLLAKETPSYISIRKKIEKNIFKKINKNLKPSASRESLQEERSLFEATAQLEESRINEDTTSETLKTDGKSQLTMYSVDSDSESDISAVNEVPVRVTKPRQFWPDQNFPVRLEQDKIGKIEETGNGNGTEEERRHKERENKSENSTEKKDPDLSIFQVAKVASGKTLLKSNPKESNVGYLNTMDELQTDSDFDDIFVKDFEENSLKSITGYFNNKDKSGEGDEDGVSARAKVVSSLERTENQSILKSSNQAKLQSGVKKKVLFVDYPESAKTIKHSGEVTSNVDNNSSKSSNQKGTLKKATSDWSSDSDWDVAIS